MADSKLTGLTEVSVPDLADVLYLVDVSDTTDDAAGSSRRVNVERLFGQLLPSICQGRLTTETGVPVSTSDRAAQGTIYFTPYNGNRVALYDGTRWRLYSFSERSLALSSLTSGKNYDVFLYNNAGTLTLELSAAWTNDTTRADALVLQDGVYVKSGATTRRWLGTIRTTGTTTTEDSETKRFVYNHYNQVLRVLHKGDTTDHVYSNTTARQWNNDAANQIEFVVGDVQHILIGANGFVKSSGEQHPQLDWTSGNGPEDTQMFSDGGGNASRGMASRLVVATVGYHKVVMTERAVSGSPTFDKFYISAGVSG